MPDTTTKQSKRRSEPPSEEPSPSKRRKTSVNEPASAGEVSPRSTSAPSEFLKDAKYYLADGDIEVCSEATVFRIHKTKIRPLGGLFSTIFEIPQPPSSEELPRLPLFGTEPNDVRYLVAYAYGDIYDLISLRREAITTLKFLLPCGPKYTPASAAITGVPKSAQSLLMRTLPFEVIRLCQEYDLPALLPMAFYHAAQLPIADIVGGIYGLGSSEEKQHSAADLIIKIVTGRDQLKLAYRNVRLRYLNEFNPDNWTDSEKCRGDDNKWDHCTIYITKTLRQFNRDGFMDARTDVLDPMPQVRRKLCAHLCSSCADNFNLSLEGGIASIWKRLPHYFDLGTWERVTEDQRAADRLYED
ncbi:hypothetical protein H0H87_004196 [Tephrocybe sp. NHM501043]|nr:hypothetical protein H0H87_004196 [Tephrocybe sp. NHM501043]